MTTLNQEAPPAAAPKTGNDFIKFDPFPKSDSYVLTVTSFNYIPDHPFERTDDQGKDFTVIKPAVELFLGAVIDGKALFVKSWPQAYSLHEKANYAKYYQAATGAAPVPGSNVSDMVGKALLVEVEVENKVSKKGTKYTVNKIKSVTKVPSVLAATATPVDKLKPALEAILAGKEDEGNAPF